MASQVLKKKWGPLIIQNFFKIRSPIAPLFQEELLEMRLSDGLSAENWDVSWGKPLGAKKDNFLKKSQPALEPLFFLEDFWEPIEFWLLWYRIKVALANMFFSSFIQTLNEAKTYNYISIGN